MSFASRPSSSRACCSASALAAPCDARASSSFARSSSSSFFLQLSLERSSELGLLGRRLLLLPIELLLVLCPDLLARLLELRLKVLDLLSEAHLLRQEHRHRRRVRRHVDDAKARQRRDSAA
jgi:hypothetical protein